MSDDKSVKAKERLTQKVESIFKKPHRAAVKSTLKKRKFEEESTSAKKEMFDDDNQRKVPESLEVSKGKITSNTNMLRRY